MDIKLPPNAAPGIIALNALRERVEQEYETLGATPLAGMADAERLRLEGRLIELVSLRLWVLQALGQALDGETAATVERKKAAEQTLALVGAAARERLALHQFYGGIIATLRRANENQRFSRN